MKKIGFILVSFLRFEETKKCINSLKKFPFVKIYVADQGGETKEKKDFYEKNNVEYYFLPFDSGLGYSRNFLVKKVKEPYIMWGDNDFKFYEESKFEDCLKILENYEDIGIVGGTVVSSKKEKNYEHFILYDKKSKIVVLVPLKYTKRKPQVIDNVKFYYVDMTFNNCIAKKEVFRNPRIRWNSKIKIRWEHLDFFLKVKYYSKWKVAFCPSFKVIHESINSPEYIKYRLRDNDVYTFADYWKLENHFLIGNNKVFFYRENRFFPYSYFERENEEIEEKKEEIVFKHNSDLVNFLGDILSLNIPFVVIEESCLDAIRFKKLYLNPDVLHIAVENEENLKKLKELAKDKNFELRIELNNFAKTKTATLYGFGVLVPYPVVPYLRKKFGYKWERYGLK